jgi:hypothetical protein
MCGMPCRLLFSFSALLSLSLFFNNLERERYRGGNMAMWKKTENPWKKRPVLWEVFSQ